MQARSARETGSATSVPEIPEQVPDQQDVRAQTPLVHMPRAAPLSAYADGLAAGDFIQPHHHDVDQLIYAATGVITVDTGDDLWVVPPSRAVWVPARIGHSIRPSGVVSLITLQFTMSTSPIDARLCRVVQVSELLRAAIMRATTFPARYGADSAHGRLAAVLLDEVAAADIAPVHLPMPVDARARRVAVAFRDDPSDRSSCARWARFTGTSERTLERLFIKETRLTFGRWQQQARLLRALQLLADGDSVTNVALDVGFSSPSAFITMFSRAMGDTPSNYFRKQTGRVE